MIAECFLFRILDERFFIRILDERAASALIVAISPEDEPGGEKRMKKGGKRWKRVETGGKRWKKVKRG